MSIKRLLCAAALLACVPQAHAFGVGARAGSTGIGADVGFSLMPTLSARVGYGWLNYSTDYEETDVSYDAKLKLSNFSVLLDWSPLGPFRVTAGLVPNDNRVELTGRPTGGSYTLNGTSYPAAAIGSLSGEIKSGNKAAPYLGIGYGNVAGAGVNFYFDLGVMFQGSPKATVSAQCGAALTPAECSRLQSDAAAEGKKLEDDAKGFKYYPVANIGVTIGF